MWGIIATWRMAVEGISEASHILQEKGDAGDAIETAIKAVEDFPYYKSVGYGGLPNEEMEVELDAAYMDGDTLSIGAVAAIKDLEKGLKNLLIKKALNVKTCLQIVLRFIIEIE